MTRPPDPSLCTQCPIQRTLKLLAAVMRGWTTKHVEPVDHNNHIGTTVITLHASAANNRRYSYLSLGVSVTVSKY